jgi:hypothetical protein
MKGKRKGIFSFFLNVYLSSALKGRLKVILSTGHSLYVDCLSFYGN